jgi:hypothetical protein
MKRACLVVVAACGHPTQQPADASPHHDARVDARIDATVDAGLCGGITSPCNQLANLGSAVTATCIAGSPPTMTGGTILDGRYVLVSAQAYASSCNGVSLPQGGPTTIAITGGCMQSIDVQGGAQNYAISTTGNALTFDRTCAGTLTVTFPYTATSTTLSELAPFTASIMIVSVFQKQ